MTELEEATAVGRAKGRRWAWNVGGTALLLVSLALNVVAWWTLTQRAESAEDQAATLAQQVQAECAAGGTLSIDGADLCERADDVAESNPDADVSAVPIPPTQEQILAAFDVWCDEVACHGRDGRDGTDGQSAPAMTQEQMVAGFAAWCATSELCRGPKGDPGLNGTNGIDGDDGASGEPGRPPTPEEIQAAVDAYCATGACVGPKGDAGPACPTGWTQQNLTVMTRDEFTPTWTDIVTCVAAPTKGAS